MNEEKRRKRTKDHFKRNVPKILMEGRWKVKRIPKREQKTIHFVALVYFLDLVNILFDVL